MKRFKQWLRKRRSIKMGAPTKPPMQKSKMKKQLSAEWSNRMHSVHKKMSRGAENIFRMIKSRTAWGNKELWKFREKGRGKQGHKAPKKPK